MYKLNKIMIIMLMIVSFSIFNSVYSNSNFVQGVYVNKITHFGGGESTGKHIRINFSNFAFNWAGIDLPTENVPAGGIYRTSIGGWSCVLETSNPYYKEMLAMLMTSYIKGTSVDIYWNRTTPFKIDGANCLANLTNVGFSTK